MGEDVVSKYTYIANDILQKISSKEYAPGQKLPSENQMAKEYNTSVPTVRRALQELTYQDVIYRVKGSGTYVSDLKGTLQEDADKKVNFTSNMYFLAFGGYSDSSVMQMIRGAQASLVKENCNLSILCKQNVNNEMDLVEVCHNNHADGIIAYVETPELDHTSFELIKKYNIPAVMIERGPDEYPHSLVATYNVDGGYQMTKYLLSLGHRNIAFVTDNLKLKAEKKRLKGYELAMKEAGIAISKDLIIGLEEKERLLEYAKQGKITAVQTVNDRIAAVIMEDLQKNGIVVPDDISIGGYDDWDEVKFVVPHITTIAQPFEEMGRTAAEKLLKMLKKEEGCSQTYLPVKLVIKDSCSAPKSLN